jgi:hypothetical protein
MNRLLAEVQRIPLGDAQAFVIGLNDLQTVCG